MLEDVSNALDDCWLADLRMGAFDIRVRVAWLWLDGEV